MKGKKIIVACIFILFICVSLLMPMNGILSYEKEYSIEKNISKYGNKTNEVNSDLIRKIKNKDYYYIENQYFDLFSRVYLYGFENENKYYITNLNDLNMLMKEEKITNSKNLPITNTEFYIPMDDSNYKHIFEEHFTLEKKEAKVIGKDDRNYSLFDISPDALLLSVVNGDIVAYAFIDNRIIDTREVMNKKYDGKEIMFIIDDDSAYNKYKIVLEE